MLVVMLRLGLEVDLGEEGCWLGVEDCGRVGMVGMVGVGVGVGVLDEV